MSAAIGLYLFDICTTRLQIHIRFSLFRRLSIRDADCSIIFNNFRQLLGISLESTFRSDDSPFNRLYQMDLNGEAAAATALAHLFSDSQLKCSRTLKIVNDCQMFESWCVVVFFFLFLCALYALSHAGKVEMKILYTRSCS